MKSVYNVLNQADKTIILNPKNPLFTLIWLHGLGDSSAGFYDFFRHPYSPLFKGARIKLLHAPFRPVTINGGEKCPSWYDIKTLSFAGKTQDEDKRCSLSEVKESLQILNKKVEDQVNYWKQQKAQGDLYKRIFVGGFSQGCAVSLLYALSCKNALGGIIGLSGYLFQSFELPNIEKLPVLLYHGSEDPMIPIQQAKRSYEKIAKCSNIIIKTKQLAHEVDLEELKEMDEWIQSKLKF